MQAILYCLESATISLQQLLTPSHGPAMRGVDTMTHPLARCLANLTRKLRPTLSWGLSPPSSNRWGLLSEVENVIILNSSPLSADIYNSIVRITYGCKSKTYKKSKATLCLFRAMNPFDTYNEWLNLQVEIDSGSNSALRTTRPYAVCASGKVHKLSYQLKKMRCYID